ncbi:hypothetical protein [Paraclostridium bifermentans]|uniref:hypothetical protein n=1 Tax=Paraclostridium bifermentans TaxID=1490 RepID=UPI00359C8F34
MSKNFQVIVRRKDNQNDFKEEKLEMSAVNNEIAVDREVRDRLINKRHIGPKERKELERLGMEMEEPRKEEEVEEKKEESKKEEKAEEKKEEPKKEEKAEEKKEEPKKEEEAEEKKEEPRKEEEVEEKKEESKKEEKKKDKKKEVKKENTSKVNPFIEYSPEKQRDKRRVDALNNINDENIVYGRGQVYRSKKVNIDKPEKDVVIKVDKIDRDIYIENIEILDDRASVLAMVTENITYYTAKRIPPKPEKKENDEKCKPNKHPRCEDFKREVICLDGVVRSTTVITPCLIHLDVIGAREDSTYEVESATVECINTKYVLEDGTIVDREDLPMGSYIESLMEGYVITISIIVK